jgi:hypothetical protein
MSSSYPIIPSRPVQPHIPTNCNQCGSQLEFPVPIPLPRPGTLLHIRCFHCQTVISHVFYPAQAPNISVNSNSAANVGSTGTKPNGHNSSASQSTKKTRKIGTQERPLETGLYDILGVPVNATTDDIKKAYRMSPRAVLPLTMHKCCPASRASRN